MTLNAVNITEAIRTPEVSLHVSTVAAMPKVREFINALMNKAVQHDVYIADGRDLGTAVFQVLNVSFYDS